MSNVPRIPVKVVETALSAPPKASLASSAPIAMVNTKLPLLKVTPAMPMDGPTITRGPIECSVLAAPIS